MEVKISSLSQITPVCLGMAALAGAVPTPAEQTGGTLSLATTVSTPSADGGCETYPALDATQPPADINCVWPKKVPAGLEWWHPELSTGSSQSSWLRMIAAVPHSDLGSRAAKEGQPRVWARIGRTVWKCSYSDITERLFGKSKEMRFIFSSLVILSCCASVLSSTCPRHPEKTKTSQKLTKTLSAKRD